MTDENFSADSSVESQQADSYTQNVDTSTAQAPETAQEQPQEKFVPQSQVNKLISDVKRKAYENGMQAANQRVNQPQTQQPQSYDQSNSNKQEFETMFNQRMAEMQEQHQADAQSQQEAADIARVDGQLTQKMEAARKEIDGFDEALSTVGNFENFRGIKYAASQFDGGGKVLHYLAKNQNEIPVLESMARSFKNPDGTLNNQPLLDQFKRISDKISLNENSGKYRSAPDPISKIQSNLNEGMGDGSRESVSDYRKYLRSTRR